MPHRLNLATFNLWKDCGDFPNRIYSAASSIKNLDIICFQEDYCSKEFCSSNEINKALNFNKLTLPIREKKRHGKVSSSNLTILSKYPAKVLENIVFNMGKKDERGAQVVELDVDGKKVVLVNTHLTNLSQKERVNQVIEILGALNTKKKDIAILCGDMNALPNAHENMILQKNGFISKNMAPTYEQGLVLDYIYYKSDLDIDAKSKVVNKKLSDHYCLKNSLSWDR